MSRAGWRRLIPGSLRGRLLLGVVVLVAIGLIGADVAGYLLLRDSLLTKAGRESAAGSTRAETLLHDAAHLRVRVTPQALSRITLSDGYVFYFDARGTVLFPPVAGLSHEQAAVVRALGPLPAATIQQRAADASWLTVADTTYRVTYVDVDGPVFDAMPTSPGTPISGVVIAVSTATGREALANLASIEAAVTAVALLALTGFAILLLRIGLRPLGEMAGVATAIAAGETSRRVPVDQADSEVNRLAIAFNRAFDERQKAEDRLRRFVADASHELRTPLTTIRGWAELYFQHGTDTTNPDDPDTEADSHAQAVRTAMSRIAEEATRMGSLVDDLLLLARLDAQRPLNTGGVDLAAVVQEVVADARVIDPARPVTVTVTTEHAEIRGDADRLRQVVRNLVGNAFQHTPAGTAVEVRVDELPAAGRRELRLTVADHGNGVSEADRSRLFERFYRTGTPGHSHGLGLAIVHAIVTAHGGRIDVRDAPTGGAEFLVDLPAGRNGLPDD